MLMRMTLLLIILMITAFAFAYAAANKVIKVYDGDTLMVEMQGEKVKIRLYGIDAPESGQHGNVSSARFLRRRVFGNTVTIKVIKTDLFGQPIAIVFREGRSSSVNAAMVANGYAWVDPAQCKADDCMDWRNLESQARKLKLGIWSGFDLKPPWEFRKQQGQ
jgi:endonuclease YncB( thermonuclease family)